ncbi:MULTISPECIES: FAD-dependent oxidoreductase [Bradyrhizobium]|uniref:FAD-dependent oxidoreductase n=1 Tax=Bradyrhizobium TaxID=374 RepID=UPI00155E1009|nr:MULTISPECIES: FAD-dependent oxidoreductase [Bradyrhizobium]MDD1520777.1 FAD-dependent oxidoreductase [Bradyrhizobium sp. WBAH30]MDD1545828.1 FAD-dependent oxidoreductase [Bradyrhizobium sp. WBAH41]MDD1558911.1 FAD-dependent oxidoreductase [Bradyrhizobium sp. WBAH23]MDD1566439.1 FAD-dependent oxidoreductase [Bradyrhizobium sp. WBAH33]MDD1592032.1 FAD-dependent oxidoreductase [Bradyrhizobium sp. WBAH42]
MLGSIVEPQRCTPVYGEYDLVVLGGGPAGLMAAAACGRAGRKVLLVERHGFLGGMGTAAGVTNFCGLYANIHGEHVQVVGGLADELLDRMRRLGGLNTPHLIFGRILAQSYDIPAFKLAADDLLIESKVSVLFHAVAVSVAMASETLVGAVILETKSGRLAVRGRLFVDGSGDGDLAVWAGAAFEKGDGSGNMLYPSTMFRINGVDPERAGEAWSKIPKLMDQAEAEGRFAFPRKGAIVRPQKNPIEWRANVTQLREEDGSAIDGTDATSLSRGELQGRAQVRETFRFLQTVPGFENSYIVDIAPQLGIRETRRILGEYVLTEDDVLGCASFEDSIGRNGWPIEEHTAGDVAWHWPQIPQSRGYNELPYRMIVPRSVDNLFIVGRCASMTHLGQSAARVTGPCFVMGEAAGTAADIALRGNVRPREVDPKKLQESLVRQGALL